MSEPVFSSSWYRVAALKPRLRRHARLHRHTYRGQVWYVLEDASTGRCHRLSVAAHQLVAQMDGSHSVEQLWEQVVGVFGDEAPTQDETIRFLGQLHAADVLTTDAAADTDEIARRHDKQFRQRLRQRLANPMAIRIPLFDPDPFLTRAMPWVRPLFTWTGLILWLILIGSAGVLAAFHWGELTGNLADRVLTPQNLIVLWLVYPLVKALHELGHGFAAKAWDSPVHEIGIMLLVLMPIPYVEASAASALQEKGRRMVVGAAGIMVELGLAAVALFIWLLVEPGVVRTIAWNVMLIGGVSTLLFNGNPLLRYDGYYVLVDAIEIPNLATRSNRYLGYLAQRYLFDIQDARSPVAGPGEAAWFFVYGIVSYCYRLFILFVIVLFIASRFFVIGVLLALWALAAQFLWPLLRQVWFLLNAPQLRRRRARALGASGALALGAASLIALLPVPSWTLADGVVWLPEDSRLRAETDAFIIRVLATDGQQVQAGQVLIEGDDPDLRLHLSLLESQRAELEARLIEAGYRDRTRLQVVREEIAAVEADLARARERLAALTVHSPGDGTLILPEAADLPGRFVKRGQVLGYVNPGAGTVVRVVVDQSVIAQVQERTKSAQVWLAGWGRTPVAAEIARLVPAATEQLPSAALGVSGGGAIATDTADKDGTKTLAPMFQLDLTLLPEAGTDFLGSRVAVRFDHGYEPLAVQWYRSLRRLFLSHFAV
jgi:putative peptide zinc metalloprotease protein